MDTTLSLLGRALFGKRDLTFSVLWQLTRLGPPSKVGRCSSFGFFNVKADASLFLGSDSLNLKIAAMNRLGNALTALADGP
jgi:hypothetical protein